MLWLFCIDKDGLAVRGKLLNEVHGLLPLTRRRVGILLAPWGHRRV